MRRTRRAQALKFHDLAHAAHWHMPVHAHQLTQLHCDMDEGPSLEDIFHMADFDGSGTLSVDGLTSPPDPETQAARPNRDPSLESDLCMLRSPTVLTRTD